MKRFEYERILPDSITYTYELRRRLSDANARLERAESAALGNRISRIPAIARKGHEIEERIVPRLEKKRDRIKAILESRKGKPHKTPLVRLAKKIVDFFDVEI